MPDSMVERVARAICPAAWEPISCTDKKTAEGGRMALGFLQLQDRETSFLMARAAIAALREPTESMIAAAYAKEDAIFGGHPRSNMNISTAWEVMIDAALTEDTR